jgi:tetratricopeptide (TPR) repeat protein
MAAGKTTPLHAARDLLRRGDLLAAEAVCDEVLRRHPALDEAIDLRAAIHHERGRFAQAAQLLRPLATRRPGDIALRRRFAHALRRSGAHTAAIAEYDAILRRAPGDTESIEGLATSLVMTGADDRVRAIIEPRWSSGTATPSMIVSLLRACFNRDEVETVVDRATRAAARSDVNPGVARRLHSLRGRALERLGRIDEAFEAFKRAASCGRLPFDRRAYSAEIDSIIATFTPSFFDRTARSERLDSIVFIVGMPRSGSTLIERMLDAHPDVKAIGESPALHDVVERFKNDLSYVDPWPHRASRLDAEAVNRLADGYLEAIAPAEGSAASKRRIDKALWNTHSLGPAALMFPAARVLWCARDAMDACLSCYAEAFEPRLAPYASDLGDLGFVHRQIERLMRHWQAVLPIPVLRVQYEDVVRDPEASIRAVLRYLDLPWHADCLDFHRKAAHADSPSHAQVRRPLYSTSVGRAARFERHLGALRAALVEDEIPRG